MNNNAEIDRLLAVGDQLLAKAANERLPDSTVIALTSAATAYYTKVGVLVARQSQPTGPRDC